MLKHASLLKITVVIKHIPLLKIENACVGKLFQPLVIDFEGFVGLAGQVGKVAIHLKCEWAAVFHLHKPLGHFYGFVIAVEPYQRQQALIIDEVVVGVGFSQVVEYFKRPFISSLVIETNGVEQGHTVDLADGFGLLGLDVEGHCNSREN